MKMTELFKYDVPWDVVQLWRDRESDDLLPLQALAVRGHGLFGKGNLLVQAPTSAGKTFIGEMAAMTKKPSQPKGNQPRSASPTSSRPKSPSSADAGTSRMDSCHQHPRPRAKSSRASPKIVSA